MEETSKKEQNGFIERLAQRLGISANASTIYGDPVERDGVIVIPAAKAMYGFGGGSGSKAGEEGTGGGGGVAIKPVGYIEIKDGNTKFKSIPDPERVIKIIAVSGVMAFFILKSVDKLVNKR
ncbi:spore germination protein GerW family protein [Pontibacter virosus]|uniref:Sporulation protein YtfJ n=1 Tax=Pontibacter virosus TaxID=1765052 RepID=A0A2U1ATP4_9BACT|nr:spore germination protein GerW family protein [Pontibacter virosus]PVY39637.1 sporulation protein YtfJ [Pontibacter virosus]